MTVHLRQYVIGPQARLVRPDWRSRALPSGLVLSHCPTLPIIDTRFGIVLGDAVSSDDSGDSGPDTWAGRWSLLSDDQLRLDTCGLLGACYRDVAGQRWISSSPEILREMAPALAMHDDRLERDWRQMDWYPPPASAIDGVSRLLPSQALSLSDGTITPVPVPTGDPGIDHETLIGRSGQRLVTAMRNTAALAAEAGGRVRIGLTAGYDSRTLLAAAVGADIDIIAYTYVRAKTPQADLDLPPRLAAAAGFEHVFIPLDNVDPERAAEFDEHTAASYAGGARLQYSSGAWDQADPADIALEGGCFEVARCYYYDRLPRDMGATTDETSDIIIERFPTQRPNGVRDWVAWLDGPGRQDGIDWRDRFYLDQRCGGWLSAGLQGFDISGRRQVFLGNDHGLLADLLSADVASRRTSAPQAEIVARLAPALADMPFNPGSGKSTRSSRASAPKQDKMTGLGARLRGLSRKRPAR